MNHFTYVCPNRLTLYMSLVCVWCFGAVGCRSQEGVHEMPGQESEIRGLVQLREDGRDAGEVLERARKASLGEACEVAEDCTGKEAVCLRDRDGFPWGYCTLPCTTVCEDLPDRDTACIPIGQPTLGLPVGYCAISCGEREGECRAGYACRVVERVDATKWPVAMCQPTLGDWSGYTSCQRRLDDHNISYRPLTEVARSLHSQSRDRAVCSIEDPVYLSGPLHGVSFRFIGTDRTAPLLVDCSLAQALERMAAILAEEGVREVRHIGTFNCRNVRGKASRRHALSQHAYGRAIDIHSVVMKDGRVWSVKDDWTRSSRRGQKHILKTIANRLHDEFVFNIVLTPDYNAAHADHLHLDLSEERHFIQYDRDTFLQRSAP